MVLSIARQSIITKCNLKKSVLLGNYELYYAAGLLKKCFRLPLSRDMEPQQLYEAILEQLPHLQPKDEREEYLVKLLSVFRPLEEYDEQMKLLFDWGANEKNMWQMHTDFEPEV